MPNHRHAVCDQIKLHEDQRHTPEDREEVQQAHGPHPRLLVDNGDAYFPEGVARVDDEEVLKGVKNEDDLREHDDEDECDEVTMVVLGDATEEKQTVVVDSQYALLAHLTVSGTVGNGNLESSKKKKS